MRYWKLKEGTLAEGTKLEYYFYKLQELKEHRDNFNDEYYFNKCYWFLSQITEEVLLND